MLVYSFMVVDGMKPEAPLPFLFPCSNTPQVYLCKTLQQNDRCCRTPCTLFDARLYASDVLKCQSFFLVAT